MCRLRFSLSLCSFVVTTSLCGCDGTSVVPEPQTAPSTGGTRVAEQTAAALVQIETNPKSPEVLLEPVHAPVPAKPQARVADVDVDEPGDDLASSEMEGVSSLYPTSPWKPPRPPIEIKSKQELAIDSKYTKLGGSAGFLGGVIEGLSKTPDGVGFFKRYVGGSIYYSPRTGAQEIGGSIRDKWASLGWERSFLGYPATDETVTPDGFGRYNHFQNGSIYYSPRTGAQEIHGAIRNQWASMGWERSYLGYPTTGVMPVSGSTDQVSYFERGSIRQTGSSATAVIPASVDFAVDSITFPDGIPVGGSTKLAIRADGSYSFEGHLHVSGAGCWNDSMLWVVRTESGRVFTFTHQGNLAGTFCPGSRDDDWIVTGKNDALRATFAEFRTSRAVVTASTGLDLGAMWNHVKTGLGYVKEVFQIAGPIIAAL